MSHLQTKAVAILSYIFFGYFFLYGIEISFFLAIGKKIHVRGTEKFQPKISKRVKKCSDQSALHICFHFRPRYRA